MTISIRLDKSVEEALRRRLQLSGIPLSEFVREAIREKLGKEADKPSPYELGKHLFGLYGSREDLSTNRKQILREILDEKHRRR